ncbi:MAG: alpha/beta hydrolase [Chloroflexi bacterium]|nr:alpha/beta hydrolase [Chloroflexota bacterium]
MMDSFTESTVEAGGFHIRYMHAGQGETLVCLHDASGLRISPAYELLAGRYRVVLLETPGFGASPANESSASLGELALTMAEAIERAGLSAVHLLGTSFGASLALWLAIKRPELVTTLALTSPAVIMPAGRTLVPPPDFKPEQWPQVMYAHPERQATALPGSPEVLAKQQSLIMRLLKPTGDPELQARMGEVSVPTLVVFGTDDRVVPHEIGGRYRELIPNCHLVLVYDAGHLVDADRPEAFADLIGDFLARREGFLVCQGSGLLHP